MHYDSTMHDAVDTLYITRYIWRGDQNQPHYLSSSHQADNAPAVARHAPSHHGRPQKQQSYFYQPKFVANCSPKCTTKCVCNHNQALRALIADCAPVPGESSSGFLVPSLLICWETPENSLWRRPQADVIIMVILTWASWWQNNCPLSPDPGAGLPIS